MRGVPGAQGLPCPGSDDREQPRSRPSVVVLPSGSWAVGSLQSSPESHFLGVRLLLRPVSHFPFAFPVLSQLGPCEHWEGAGHGRCGLGGQGASHYVRPCRWVKARKGTDSQHRGQLPLRPAGSTCKGPEAGESQAHGDQAQRPTGLEELWGKVQDSGLSGMKTRAHRWPHFSVSRWSVTHDGQ